MSKTQRDIIIATILVIIFIISFSVNILKVGQKKSPPPPDATEQSESLAMEAGISNLVFVTNLRANDIVLKSQEKFWEGDYGHDPFMTAAAVSEKGDIQSLELKGIFWDEENPKAIVNGKMVSKGDSVMGYQVTEINYQSVVFWTGDKNVELRLFKGGVPDQETAPDLAGKS